MRPDPASVTIARRAPWLLAAVPALVLVCELLPVPPSPPPSSPPPSPPPPAATAAVAPRRPVPDLAAILARPLFTSGRHPPSEDHAEAPPRLAGTVVGPHGLRLAILSLQGRDRPLVLGQGGSAAGVSVIAVAPGRVLAAIAQRRVLLTLHGADRPDGTPMAAPEMTKDARVRDPNNQDE